MFFEARFYFMLDDDLVDSLVIEVVRLLRWVFGGQIAPNPMWAIDCNQQIIKL
jgi:hypothetical protein